MNNLVVGDTLQIQRSKINDAINALNNKTLVIVKYLDVEDPRLDGYTTEVGVFGVSTDKKLWIKTNENDTDWEQILITENGNFYANYKLLDASGILIPSNSLALVNNQVVIGDGYNINGSSIQFHDDSESVDGITLYNCLRFTTSKAGSTINIDISGYSYEGIPFTGIKYNINYFNTYSVNASEYELVTVQIPDTYGVPTTIHLWAHSDNYYPWYIHEFISDNNSLCYIDLYECLNIYRLELYNESDLKFLNITNSRMLEILTLNNININKLSLIYNTLLRQVNITNTAIKYLDITFLTNLEILNLSNNQILSIVANNNTFENIIDIIDLSNNQLTTDALYEFFDSVGNTISLLNINVVDNPCLSNGELIDGNIYTANQTQALATLKGFNLITS